MSISNILVPNNYSLYLGGLEVSSVAGFSESISNQQLYNAVSEVGEGAPNSLSGYDNEGTYANVTVGTGLSLSGNVLTAVGSGSGNVVGSPPSVAQTPAIYTDTTGLVIGSSPDVAVTNDTLLGYNGGNLSNITAGTNITIASGVISAVGSGTGDVNGPGSSVAFTPAQFADTTGKLLSQPSVTATADTLIGYSDAGAMVNITAGPNITISGSVISASGGSGGGNVTGPESSTNHGLALFNGTSGELL